MVVGLLGFVGVLVLMALAPRARGVEAGGLPEEPDADRRRAPALSPGEPAVPDRPGPGRPGRRRSPIKAMLDAFVIPDLLELHDPTSPEAARGPPGGSGCPAWPARATRTRWPAVRPGDQLPGQHRRHRRRAGRPVRAGPGRDLRAEIEAADGLGFTAASPSGWSATAGTGEPGPLELRDRARARRRRGLPRRSPADRWRGDAGSDWAEAAWRSTLYNHALAARTPPRPASPRTAGPPRWGPPAATPTGSTS